MFGEFVSAIVQLAVRSLPVIFIGIIKCRYDSSVGNAQNVTKTSRDL